MFVMETNLTVSSTTSWVIDSGSSIHLCTSMQDLKECRRLRLGEITPRIGNEAKVDAVAVGTSLLRLSSDFCLKLRDCYCVPNASRNLISISCFAQDDYEISFNKNHCTIYFGNKMIARGHLINSLYHLHVDADESINPSEQIVSVVGFKRFRDEVNLSIYGTLG